MSGKLYQDFQRQRQIPLTVLGGQPPYQTQLIQDTVTGKILVQKKIQKENIPIYQKLQQLQSPHLVKIISCEEQQDVGVVIEEYVSGETLDEKLHRQGTMPAEQPANKKSRLK